MLNTLNINLKTDIKTDRPTTLPITLMSQDKNNNQFILRFTNGGESVTLDDNYTIEILTKFTKSGTSRLTTAKVRQDYATWEFDTAYITQDETVYNYVYVRKSGSLIVSADANCFVFSVDLSEIDKGAGRVAETYDENYQKYLDEFKDVADFTAIQQAEADRESAETTRISNENARKSAEVIRLASEVDRVNAENVRSGFYEGFDGEIATLKTEVAKKANKKQEEWITPTLLNGFSGNLNYRKTHFGELQLVGTLISPVAFSGQVTRIFDFTLDYSVGWGATFHFIAPTSGYYAVEESKFIWSNYARALQVGAIRAGTYQINVTIPMEVS